MRHLITVGFIVLAIVLYTVGVEKGSAALFIGGIVCELVFAKRARRQRLS